METTLPEGFSLEAFRHDFVLTASADQHPEFCDAKYQKMLLTFPGELVCRLVGWRFK